MTIIKTHITINGDYSMAELKQGPISTINLGLAGASFAGVLSMLQVSTLDTYLTISLVCFALILPMNLIVGLFTLHPLDKDGKKSQNFKKFSKASVFITPIVALIGVVCLILHFSIAVGIIFFIVTLLTIFVFFSVSSDE